VQAAALDHMQRVAGDLGANAVQHPDRFAGSIRKQRSGRPAS
jgi:hypothetical protein